MRLHRRVSDYSGVFCLVGGWEGRGSGWDFFNALMKRFIGVSCDAYDFVEISKASKLPFGPQSSITESL